MIFETAYPTIAEMNLSSSAPLVNGNNYSTGILNWLNTQILPSGEWDGVYFDNLLGFD